MGVTKTAFSQKAGENTAHVFSQVFFLRKKAVGVTGIKPFDSITVIFLSRCTIFRIACDFRQTGFLGFFLFHGSKCDTVRLPSRIGVCRVLGGVLSLDFSVAGFSSRFCPAPLNPFWSNTYPNHWRNGVRTRKVT